MRTPLTSRRLRALTAATAVALVAPLTVVGSSPATADDDATLTVVGTSDVFDSFLVQTVLEPEFEKAYPQYDLRYVSRGTGAAIAFAKAGTASAMIVHAAALENQFVDEGYSAEPYGRAIFWGDYVLLGPESDPAGVLDGSQKDIVSAYEKVAEAGEAGRAEFVSRGGTPGTTVQEHAIWALTDGVDTCTVSAANGGGTSPSTSGGSCGSPIAYPSWYHATGLTQGPNILAGDACNGFESDACYVFTDRGTFNYLDETGAISDLGIVTRDNDVAGQLDLLVNSFHAYVIDPEKFADNPDVTINVPAATAFLDWMTSPAGQAAVGAYLSEGGDPPFIPSASPAITTDPLPATIDPGPVRITGSVENVVPGTPVLDGVPVTLLARPASAPGRTPVQVATTRTGASGNFAFSYRPARSLVYTVATDQITKIQNDQLDPPFGDLLAPASVQAGTVRVRGKVALRNVARLGQRIKVTGAVGPKVTGRGGQLALVAGRAGRPLRLVATRRLTADASTFSFVYRLGAGRWRYQLRYLNPSAIVTGTTSVRTVTLR